MGRTAATTLGETLRRLREDRGLGIRSVAKAANISATYLSQLENDKSKPTERVVFNLASALDCNEDELLSILGRVAKDVQDIILRQPRALGALILAVDGLPEPEIAKLTNNAERLKANLGAGQRKTQAKRD
jgi:transcriptional regulator with XRE-family HTH domain